MKGECLQGSGSWCRIKDWSKQGKTKADDCYDHDEAVDDHDHVVYDDDDHHHDHEHEAEADGDAAIVMEIIMMGRRS